MLYGCLLSSLEIKALAADKKKVERYKFMIRATEKLESQLLKYKFQAH